MLAATRSRFVRLWALGAVAASFFCSPSALADTSTTLTPEVDLYLTHNQMFRSRIITSASWSDTSSRWSSGFFEYAVDFGLLSFFRRYVYRDPNQEKNQLLSVRLGYGYLPDYDGSDGTAHEHRGVVELSGRLPIGGKWLITDRNKFDLRWIDDTHSMRYRNRLRMERGMLIGKLRGTPYASGEAYYDTNGDLWNRFETRVGMEFPWYQSSVLEFYYAHQAVYKSSSVEIIGFVFQKHMVMPLGGSQ